MSDKSDDIEGVGGDDSPDSSSSSQSFPLKKFRQMKTELDDIDEVESQSSFTLNKKISEPVLLPQTGRKFSFGQVNLKHYSSELSLTKKRPQGVSNSLSGFIQGFSGALATQMSKVVDNYVIAITRKTYLFGHTYF